MYDKYQNPLESRYSSKEMLYNFSPQMKFSTWRKLWLTLAEVEKELGLNITDEQLEEIRLHLEDIDYEKAAQYEKQFRHDVMAHIHTLSDVAPKAAPILHLGVTSAFVQDNTVLIQLREGLLLVKKRIVNVLNGLSSFAMANKSLPTLGFTHYQPAQLTTVGKRATLWMQSLLLDLEDLEYRLNTLQFRGVKGTTGTAASFKELFDGNYEKVKILDQKISEKFGFKKILAVTGQTYDRKIDAQILDLLSGIAQSAHKFTNDLRLLQNLKEMEEPFEKSQIGSSAMAYKRNPMRSERIASLAKYVMSLAANPAMVASTQWFERTLDDSANRRLSIPQAFLAIDAILMIWDNVVNGLVVYPKVIEKHIMAELPFMATENIIMEGVKNGGDRQELHELIRQHSMEAGKQVKELGKPNDLIERILSDSRFNVNKERLLNLLDPKNFTGFAEIQTEEFIAEKIRPIIEINKDLLGEIEELKV
ncbi:MAG: adenylosuccinate lyase [Weeksellaceae bacterium]